MRSARLRIATRKSPLAMCQAELIKQALLQHHPQLDVELIGFTTQGDIHLDTPLATIGGKGLFVKELEHALLKNEADIAVHSIKDLPVDFPEGLMLATICEREDPRDAFISNTIKHFSQLPNNARLGTSSLRRQCQIKALRPDVDIIHLRGNVQTRLQKLDQGDYDAIILAAAGLHRLNLIDRVTEYFNTDILLPAVGQGALGIECRIDDAETQKLIAPLEHQITHYCVAAERAFNQALNGGCQVPIAAFAEYRDEKIFLRGLVGSPDGKKQIRGAIEDKLIQATEIGKTLAEELLQKGAGDILRAVYRSL